MDLAARGHTPAPNGLYDPSYEHDGCGVACLARLDGKVTRETVERAIGALVNLEHRGAEGADPSTGDGAGILMQIPDAFMRAEVHPDLPPAGQYGVAFAFLPQEPGPVQGDGVAAGVGGARGGPGADHLARRARDARRRRASARARWHPTMRQLFLDGGSLEGDALERKLYVVRRRAENESGGDLYLPSCSCRTIVYKGMLSAPQLARYYPDLADERLASALAIVHSRFSTNTFPSWSLAHPFHMSAHNGEFNTLLGNVSWMRAREARLAAGPLGDDVARTLPAIPPGSSDSAAFDAVLELLVRGGRSLEHAVMLMTPEAHEGRPDMPEALSDFYDYGSMLMEPWDGPASVTFTDGKILGATLDRNGLRPGRWVVTRDGWFALASEAGAFHVPSEDVERVGRLLPGRLVVVDPERGGLLEDRQAELDVAGDRPYGAWFAEHSLGIDDLPAGRPQERPAVPREQRQLAFGWTQEDVRAVLAPMAAGAEAVGSMGNDVALAAISERQPPLFTYFKQLFAQVTNPAIDPVREKIVMSLRTVIGPEGDLFEETPEQARRLVLEHPVIEDEDLARIRAVEGGPLTSQTLDFTWPIAQGEDGLAAALEELFAGADRAIADGHGVLILSDRAVNHDRAAMPSLLAVSAVHHHLVRSGTRTRVGLIVESGEPRDPHHIAALIGYGAAAVNPYLMLESTDGESQKVIASMEKSLLKIISKMGISTIRSYNGAQVFEAVGLDRELVQRHFTGTPSRIGGIGLDGLAREALHRHSRAWPDAHGEALPDHVEDALLPAASKELLPQGGQYQWRRDGEKHMWEPATITGLQAVARGGGRETYKEFARRVDEENASFNLLRGLMRLRTDREPISVSEVEPVAEIVKRFTTGAMSLGSLSPEAHETLAIAMNRLGGRSNTGEGGEDPRRYAPDPNGDLRRSAIKQVASGRFGVTTDYLVNADQIQIKVAQGAKPGEGGQLPGHKITAEIGRLRLSTPGVELISPPPHHDIYSIEDLKQLIYDLRCVNPRASISVKLCAEVGVGTVAAGVVKANADHIVIAGHDGGTGAASLSSIHHAGVPWEIGLAETQQTLIRNDLRSRVMLQADGQMRTGRDVVVAALLGADEVGFSTAPLVATGCIMMRVCHLNTCPVGIATQDPVLRDRFQGKPEHVVRYLLAVAEEVRELMAGLGFATFQEMVGQVEMLEADPDIDRWKAGGIDLSELLAVPENSEGLPRRHEDPPTPVLDDSVDHIQLLPAAARAIRDDEPVRLDRDIANVHRTVGALLSGEIVRRRGPEGLPEGTIDVVFNGSAGQSFAAWLAPGVTFTVNGTVNDYAGKGLSGGVFAVHPPAESTFDPDENVIAGNVALYGATGGRAFFRGLAGERFAVRNSGAMAVVEGVGDHGCEYMTGGRVVVLGPTGVNFAAGMSGGIAWVLDDEGAFAARCNQEMVDLEPPAPEDYPELRDLLAEHHARTGSKNAESLLEDESAWASRLVRVMPRDYRAALQRAAEEDDRRAEGAPA